MLAFDDKVWLERPPGPVLVAVSGGADSVALLHLLHQHPKSTGAPLVIAHFHHGLRGAAADRDARCVQTHAETLGRPVVFGRADVDSTARQTGESVEMAARRLRHAFFQEQARLHGCNAIVTGHTADDQLETLFLRLGRGSSLSGMGGMPEQTACGSAIPLLRPLLKIRHADLCDWLSRRQITWNEDESNTHATIPRNRVRMHLLPAFEAALGPAAFNAALRTMSVLRDDNDVLDALADEHAAACRNADGTLNPTPLCQRPVALRRRILAARLYACGCRPASITLATLARIDQLCLAAAAGTREVPIGEGWVARRCNATLAFIPPEAATPPQTGAIRSTSFVLPRTNAVLGPFPKTPDGRAHILSVSQGGPLRKPPRTPPRVLPATCSLTPALMGAEVVIRPPKPGDRISPAGGALTRKLSDILTDFKVPRHDRINVLVLAKPEGNILWLPGYAVDTAAAVRPGETPIQLTLDCQPPASHHDENK